MRISIIEPSRPVTEPKVSILVPVYNGAMYIDQCLDSLTKQSLNEIQIICINDGSTDLTLEGLKKRAVTDPRIMIIDKKNSGYGDSLNVGIAHAIGKFVGILEADDFTRSEMYADLLSLAELHNADIVKSDFYEVNGKRITKAGIIPVNDADKLISPIKNHDIFRAQPSIWSAIYRRDFLINHKINFLPTPGAAFQDTSFNLKVLSVCDRLWMTQNAYVHYRRDNTSSSINSNDKIFSVCNEYEEFEKFISKYPSREAELSGLIQSLKFETYSWNLARLGGGAQQEFYNHMFAEFKRLYDDGKLDAKYYKDDLNLLEELLSGNPKFISSSVETRKIRYKIVD